jgi:hypothetical protein
VVVVVVGDGDDLPVAHISARSWITAMLGNDRRRRRLSIHHNLGDALAARSF